MTALLPIFFVMTTLVAIRAIALSIIVAAPSIRELHRAEHRLTVSTFDEERRAAEPYCRMRGSRVTFAPRRLSDPAV